MMNIWGMSDVGMVRQENQDSFGMRTNMPSGHSIGIVCDGMGGTAGGKLASKLAVSTFMETLKELLCPDMSPQELLGISAKAIARANEKICEAATLSAQPGMGTTLVCAIGYENGVAISNVGDSRAYLVTPEKITRITKDHSMVENMLDRGEITAEQARTHPKRNIITRALCPGVDSDCDSFLCEVNAGEYILLCSDGLVNTVTDAEMQREVIHAQNLEESLNHLLALSKSRGAPDNVTAVLMRML